MSLLHTAFRPVRSAPGLMIAGLIARVLVLLASPGHWLDLQIYHHFGSLILDGQDPYRAPPGAISPTYADMPPLNLLVFAAVLAVWNSPVALRLFFILVDCVLILILGRTRHRRFAAFYALSPLPLMAWVATTQDKCVVFGLLVAVLLLLEQRRPLASVIAAGILTAYKWMGALFAIPLIVFGARGRRNRELRSALILGGVYASLFLLGHAPFFPSNLVAYVYRSHRLVTDPPIHASPTLLLSRLGIYGPEIATGGILLSLAVIYFAFWRGRLDIRQTVVLSVFFPYMLGPELSFNRILLITLPFLLVVPLTRRGWMQVWIVTTVAAIALFLQVRGVPPALSRWDGFAELCQRIFGRVGTPQHVIFMNLFPALMLYHFFRHHRRRGSPDPHKKPAPLHEGPLPLHFTVQEPHAGRIGNPTRVLAPEPTQRRGCPPR